MKQVVLCVCVCVCVFVCARVCVYTIFSSSDGFLQFRFEGSRHVVSVHACYTQLFQGFLAHLHHAITHVIIVLEQRRLMC